MKLDDFLNCKKVRCVNFDATGLTNKEYELLGVTDRSCIINDNGCEIWVDINNCEPVLDSAEKPLQNMKLTPEFEAVDTTFKVGDKVYFGISPKIKTIESVHAYNNIKFIDTWGCVYARQCCHATQENYERLQATFTDIEFERPPLTGSDLARAMLEKGWQYIPCYVSNYGESEAQKPCIVRKFSSNGQFVSEFEFYNNAVPFDPRTGEPLTESILND